MFKVSCVPWERGKVSPVKCLKTSFVHLLASEMVGVRNLCMKSVGSWCGLISLAYLRTGPRVLAVGIRRDDAESDRRGLICLDRGNLKKRVIGCRTSCKQQSLVIFSRKDFQGQNVPTLMKRLGICCF